MEDQPLSPPVQTSSDSLDLSPVPAHAASFLTAYLLSQFLGPLGADRFYLGYKKQGFIKLFTIGGFGVWYLIDQILLLTNNLPAKNGAPLDGYAKYRRPALAIFVVGWLLVLVVGWSAISALEKGRQPVITLRNGINTSNTPPATAATADTPFGQTAHGSGDSAGLAIQIPQVIPNPATTGDPPSPGLQYVEIDLVVTNNGRSDTVVPGTFYYQTAGGSLLNTADAVGKPPQFPGKNVQITNKEPLSSLYLAAGQSDSSHYLIYQIPATDKGKLIWYQGQYDTTSTKLAVFDLY